MLLPGDRSWFISGPVIPYSYVYKKSASFYIYSKA